MLLEKCDNALKTSEHTHKCIAVDEAKANIKKTTVTVSPAKRLSVDNYCSNWLSSTYSKTNESDNNIGLIETNYSYGQCNNSSNSKAKNGHDNQFRGFQASKMHRRSLSENIIPFPPHTAPCDKARHHLINRKNSHFNTSSEALDEPESPMHAKQTNATENGAECPIGIFSNTTLRKVAETMFLKVKLMKIKLNILKLI